MTEDDLLNLIPLDKENSDIADKILKENDLEKTQELTHLFNLNQAKRNAIRVLKLNSLLDKVSDQMIERFEKRPGEFSNSDLLSYMTTVQSAIDRANKSLNLIDETPAIKIDVNNVNIGDTQILNRESREKVSAALTAIMNFMDSINNSNKEDNIIIEVEDNENKEGSVDGN